MARILLILLAVSFSFNCAHLDSEGVQVGMITGELVMSPISSDCFYVRDEFDNETQSVHRYMEENKCLDNFNSFNVNYADATTYWYVKRDGVTGGCYQYCRTDVTIASYSYRERSRKFSLRARVAVSCLEYPPEKHPEPDLEKGD
jgi:hypothetical protein